MILNYRIDSLGSSAEKTLKGCMEARRPAENTVRPMPTPHRPWWPLIAALALAAMVSGHALELWLENLRVLGDGRASYAHSLQTFAIEAALVLLVVGLALIASHVVGKVYRAGIDSDDL